MQTLSVLSLFPQVVGIYKITMDSQKILKLLDKFEWTERDPKDITLADYKAYSGSSFDLLSRHSKLKKSIETCITSHIQETLKQNTKYRMTTSWATKLGPGGYARLHYHANAWLSGVYYPASHKSFRIRFYNLQQQWFDEPKEYNTNNSVTWTIPVEENMVIIFPSLLCHELLTNESNNFRYSIAFNVLPKGMIGGKDSDSYVQL